MDLDALPTVHRDDELLVVADHERIAASDTVMVSFTGIGHGMGAINLQRIEFAGTAAGHGGLVVVTDLQRSWGNNIAAGRLADIVDPLVGGRRVITLGNSMGGFLAVLFAGELSADVALAFAPQFSVDPRLMPDEHRWDEYTARIDEFRYPSLDDAFRPGCRFYTFNGGSPLEQRHWSRFPRVPHAEHWVIDEIVHHVGRNLKGNGVLRHVIRHAVEGDLSADHFLPLHARLLAPCG